MNKLSYFDIDYQHLSVSQIIEQIDDYAAAGADVHEIDSKKRNILIKVAHLKKEYSERLIAKFVELGADMYFKNSDGDFPIRSCARSGTVLMFKAFLDAGLNLNKFTLEEKKDISVAATYNSDPEMLKLMIDLGMYDYSAHQQDIMKKAILFNNEKVVQSMLDSKIDLSNQNFLDEAVFTMNKFDDEHEAMKINHQIVQSLIQAGAKLLDESSVINQAISNYHIAVHTIKLLKEIGVNWNILSPTEQKEVEKIS